ncbi:flagellar brake protein [Motiliproteus sp. SC1-56]|uniref:flagellar brake protein n=1 Tax=Motiliproteus sp. SC1-56 TaxID=2799565 RepID=UPI001A907777|nr:flagellar brake protein [Motiliproteus sp. SC1-56]
MTVAQLTQGSKEQLRFDELRVPVGERVQLETRSPRGRFSVRYVGHVQDKGLLVSLPMSKRAPKLLSEGTPVTLRLMAQNRACAFSSRVQKAQLAPVPLLFLDYPAEVEAVLVRHATRVRSRLIVSVDGGEEVNLSHTWPRQALCSDISLEGARLEASDLLGEVGDPLYVTARVQVGDVDQVLLLHCRVRTLEEVEDPFSGDYRLIHGVEFEELDEETRLILTGFVYQQMLREQVGL